VKVRLDEAVFATQERQHFGEGVLPGAHMPGEPFDVEREEGERLIESDLPVIAARSGKAHQSPSAPEPGESVTSPPPVEPTTAQRPAEGEEETA
jgi:hypothetical protein